VKVTPAHDPNDFEMGKKHGLEFITVMDPEGNMNAHAGPYQGMDRFQCRRQVVEDLRKDGLIEKIEPYGYAIGHCYRCDTIIEPYLSEQWFVKMKPLAEPAIDVVRSGRVRFFPERWEKVYLHWMENIRDWCISRQLWWGHRIPVWTCASCGHFAAFREEPSVCPACGGSVMKQEEDVLDTWFSSWLWPFSTLGWPEDTPDLGYYYPTDTLVTAPEIIFFWVARMIMAGLEFMGEIPFSEVHIHGIVRDDIGRKMSKSLGNSPDPLDLIAEVGADALRFGLIMIAPRGQDIFFSTNSLLTGRAFANKLWNAARFILMNLDAEAQPYPPLGDAKLLAADRWILNRLNQTISQVTDGLREYRLNDSARALYTFVWSEFCDWYIELAKPVLHGKIPGSAETVRAVLAHVMQTTVRLLHPFMPFITEEIWHNLPGTDGTICLAAWPEAVGTDGDDREVAVLISVIAAIRNIRGEMNVRPGAELDVYVRAPDAVTTEIVTRGADYIRELTRAARVESINAPDRTKLLATTIVDGIEVHVDLADYVDVDGEISRLDKEIKKAAVELERVERKLGNPSFIEKAPADVVEKNRVIQDEYRTTLTKLQAARKKMTALREGHA
ncbi:valine--tRNA ligase, partial [bacterium]|nr:valine--tRNA ligase [candidate division CSSED10-310 bacterium]